MSKDKAQLRGIVVVGDSLEQAKGFFAAVASGTDVSVYASANGEMQIATASADTTGIQILDPLNGEELVPVTAADGVIESLASASGTEVEAHYVQCTAGCNSHIIADDAALLHKCPACASDLPDLENPNVKPNQIAGTAGQPEEALIAFATSFEEASKQYVALVKGEIQPHAYQCDDVVVACASAMPFHIFQGVESVATEHVPTSMAAIASAAEEAGENVPAHHFMCVSKSCGTHVVASNESPLFCPGCSAGLIDPADVATASDDDDEEDEDEDFDDLNDDEDDEDEEEDAEVDEDDDDEEDDDFDEDDDEAITLSVSSAKPAGGVRKKVKAQASADTQTQTQDQPQVAAAPVVAEPLVSVAASFVALSANEMQIENVDVAYAGSIAGDGRWYAFHNGIPFAQAVASASKVENFASDVFGRTFKAIAAEQGVAVAMTELGFTEIKPEIKVEQFVQAEVTSQVESRVAQIAQASANDAAEFNSRFLAAIATASQGINSGFYKGEAQNPISVALAAALEGAGISGGADLVAQCFARHGDGYHKALVAKASQIMQYDLTVQNQMAQAVADHQNPQTQGEVSVASTFPVGRPVVDNSLQQQPVHQRETSIASASTDDFTKRLQGLSFGRKAR